MINWRRMLMNTTAASGTLWKFPIGLGCIKMDNNRIVVVDGSFSDNLFNLVEFNS